MRVLLSVYDKTGLEDFARRPGRARPRADRQRRDGRRPGRRRHPAHHRRVGDRRARDARRPGQDPPPAPPRRHPGRPRQPDPPGRPGRPGHRADRAGGLQPVPLPLQPVHRAHRRRRPDHGAGRGQELGPRGVGRRPGRLRRGARRSCAATGALSDGLRRRLAAAAFAHTAAYDAAIANWFAAQHDGDDLPATIHLSLEQAQPLRYGENPHQRGARYRETGEPQLVGRRRPARRHGAVLPQPLRRRRGLAAGPPAGRPGPGRGGGRQARQPVRGGGGRRCADGLRPGLRVRPDVGVRRHRGPDAPRSPRRWRPRWSATPRPTCSSPRPTTPAALELFAAKRKNMRVLAAPPPGADRWHLRQISGGWLVQDPYRFAAGRGRVAGGHQGPADGGPVAGHGAGLAGVRVRSSPTPSCWPPAAWPSASAAASRTGSRPARSPPPGPPGGPRAGRPPATPSSRSGTAWTRWPPPGWRR